MKPTTAEKQEIARCRRRLTVHSPQSALRRAQGPEQSPGAIRNAGTALIEFVLAIPFLAVVISLTFFFGWSLKNQQRIKVSDRYLAWNDTANGGNQGGADINVTFFENKAVKVKTTYDSSPAPSTETLNDMVTKSGQVAGPVAQYMADNSPHGCAVSVGAEFPPPTSTSWQQFTGQMTGDYVREGVEWRHTQASSVPGIVNQYLASLDSMFANMPGPANSMGGMFRNLYNSSWR